ncbi:MAG: O-antigen ligase family protein, partial [Candidatus Kerfeldbacteria bacterium]|nr:O-antigen ligase family protein [Candidatus Kerfeldbacteria bacterium]
MIYFFFVIALILSAFRRPWGIALLVVAWIIFLASSGGIIPPFTPPQLAVTAAVATFILTRYKPNRGVALLIIAWPTYIWRINILHVPTTALELSVYATLLAGLMHTPFRRHLWSRVRAIPKSWWTVLALWVIAWILSAAFSADKQASFGALKAWLVDPLLFAGILAGTVQTATDRIYLLQAAITSGFVVSMFGLYQVVWLRTELQDGRLSSFFHPVANYAAMYLGPIFVMGLGALMYKILRGWWWAAVIMVGLALALTLSYGAFLAVAVGAVTLWVFLPPSKTKRNIAVVTILTSVLAVLGLSQTKNFAEHFTNPDRTSAAVRYQIWRTTWEIIKHHPLFGVGPNNFE